MKTKKNIANVEVLPTASSNFQLENGNIGIGNTGNTGNNQQTPNALTVRLGEIAFPEGVETLGEKANYLHRCSVEYSKKSTGAAILAGWVLSVARSTCAHGQWYGWLEQNVSFSKRTSDNYMSLYAQTLGAARATARRPIALSVEPTAEELEAAAHDVDGKALSALYKSTRLVATSENWGGAGRGQGRHKKGAKNAKTQEAEAKEEMIALDEVAETASSAWATVRDHLRPLQDAQRDHHVIDHLNLVELAEAHSILKSLCSDAEAALKRLEKV